jgi:hypothetical protein
LLQVRLTAAAVHAPPVKDLHQLILTTAVLTGLLAGMGRAKRHDRPLNLPDLRLIWLAVIAFLIQLFLFQLPATRVLFSDLVVAAGLVISQLILLIFAGRNFQQPGFWLLTMGLVLNFLVIVGNGGFMPIAPATLQELIPHAPEGYWAVGERLGVGKDIVLSVENTRLWWLSDSFLLPNWFPYRVAFSLGDVFIFLGAFWTLWMVGSASQGEDQ